MAAFSTSSIKLTFVSTCRLLHGVCTIRLVSLDINVIQILRPDHPFASKWSEYFSAQSILQAVGKAEIYKCATPPDLKRAAQHVACKRNSCSSLNVSHRNGQKESVRFSATCSDPSGMSGTGVASDVSGYNVIPHDRVAR